MPRRPKVETPVDPEVIAALNAAAEERFKLEIELKKKNEAFEEEQNARAAAHAAETLQLKTAIDALDASLWKIIGTNRAMLIPPGRESFVTGVATFKFDNYSAKHEITDTKGFMDLARELRVVRFVAKPIRKWQLLASKALNWLDEAASEMREKFEPFIEEIPAWRKLSVAPNQTYAVVIDGTRLTPPPITSRRDVDANGNTIEPTKS